MMETSIQILCGVATLPVSVHLLLLHAAHAFEVAALVVYVNIQIIQIVIPAVPVNANVKLVGQGIVAAVHVALFFKIILDTVHHVTVQMVPVTNPMTVLSLYAVKTAPVDSLISFQVRMQKKALLVIYVTQIRSNYI